MISRVCIKQLIRLNTLAFRQYSNYSPFTILNLSKPYRINRVIPSVSYQFSTQKLSEVQSMNAKLKQLQLKQGLDSQAYRTLLNSSVYLMIMQHKHDSAYRILDNTFEQYGQKYGLTSHEYRQVLAFNFLLYSRVNQFAIALKIILKIYDTKLKCDEKGVNSSTDMNQKLSNYYSSIEYFLGASYFNAKQYGKAEEWLKKYLCKDAIEIQAKMRSMNYLMSLYYKTKQMRKALQISRQILQLTNKTQVAKQLPERFRAGLLLDVAEVQQQAGEQQSAKQIIQNVYSNFNKQMLQQIQILINYDRLLNFKQFSTKRVDQAIEWVQNYSKQQKDKSKLDRTLTILSTTYTKLSKHEKIIQSGYRQIQLWQSQTPMKYNKIAQVYNNIAAVYYTINKFEKSYQSVMNALRNYRYIKRNIYQIDLQYFCISIFHLKLAMLKVQHKLTKQNFNQIVQLITQFENSIPQLKTLKGADPYNMSKYIEQIKNMCSNHIK